MLIIKTNIMTGNRKCQFEYNGKIHYAFQPADASWTAIYVDDPNVMIGRWVKYCVETKMQDAIDMFMMQPNKYKEVSTYNYATLPADIKTMADYKWHLKDLKETTGSVISDSI